MKIGVIGRTNVGKSTFFKALTLENIKIEDRPFTTIEPNRGIAYVTVKCPESEFGKKCSPHNAPCKHGTRFVPLEMIDVAGLVENAHEGRGLGNKFLSDAMEADGLIEVVDASGTTDSEGMHTSNYEPLNDVKMVKNELVLWISSLIKETKLRSGDDISIQVSKKLSGVKIGYDCIKEKISEFDIKTLDNDDTLEKLSNSIIASEKPILIAANKMDLDKNFGANLENIKKNSDYECIPCSAEAELALKEAEKNGFIDYFGNSVEIKGELNEYQKGAMDVLKRILNRFGTTGVQEALNSLVFDVMKAKVVFTVEDENKMSDKRGNVLPDAYIVPKDANPKDVASIVHTEIAKRYKGAIDCRTGLKIKNDEPVKNGQIIKILV